MPRQRLREGYRWAKTMDFHINSNNYVVLIDPEMNLTLCWFPTRQAATDYIRTAVHQKGFQLSVEEGASDVNTTKYLTGVRGDNRGGQMGV